MTAEGGGAEAGAGPERAATPFGPILRRLVDSTPGALGAVFADDEGETVDCQGVLEPMDLMLAAAHMGVVLARFAAAGQKADAGRIENLRIASGRVQYVTRPIGHGYQITVVLEPVATLPKLERALDQAMVQLLIEAGGVID